MSVHGQEYKHTDTGGRKHLLCSFSYSSGSAHAIEETQQSTFSLCNSHPVGTSQGSPDHSPQSWKPSLGGISPCLLHPVTLYYIAPQSPTSITSVRSDPRAALLVSTCKTHLTGVHFPSKQKPGALFKLLGGPRIQSSVGLSPSSKIGSCDNIVPETGYLCIHFLFYNSYSGILIHTKISWYNVNKIIK